MSESPESILQPMIRTWLQRHWRALAVLASAGPAGRCFGEQVAVVDLRGPPYLVRTDTATREQDARRDQAARGRHAAGRGQVGRGRAQPRRRAAARSSMPPTRPSTPASAPFDELVKRATARRLRIVMTITGDAPRWATSGERGGNYKPDPVEYGRFVTAVAQALLGRLRATSRRSPSSRSGTSRTTSSSSSRRRRRPGSTASSSTPRSRRFAPTLRPNAKILIGELKPTPRKGLGPATFLQGWLCLDKEFKRLRGASRRGATAARASRRSTPTASPITRTGRSRSFPRSATSSTCSRSGAWARRSTSPRRPAGSARPADLQHRVRHPVEPARHLRRDEPGAAGGADKREGGVRLPLFAAQEPLPVPALRRSGEARPAGGQVVRLPDRPEVRRTAARSPHTTPTGSRSSCGSRPGARSLIWGRVRPGTGAGGPAAAQVRRRLRQLRRAHHDELARLLLGQEGLGSYRFQAYGRPGAGPAGRPDRQSRCSARAARRRRSCCRHAKSHRRTVR